MNSTKKEVTNEVNTNYEVLNKDFFDYEVPDKDFCDYVMIQNFDPVPVQFSFFNNPIQDRTETDSLTSSSFFIRVASSLFLLENRFLMFFLFFVGSIGMLVLTN